MYDMQVVHNDFTLTSAPLRLQMLAEPPKVNDTWKPPDLSR